ncbi:MAG: hypothetical protein LUC91_02865 [Prevotella sp.]|nr:hypothetical protein [Prevotella sp.]
MNPSKITIAGFDGFVADGKNNYLDDSYQNDRHISDFEVLNTEICSMLTEISETLSGKCSIDFLTPSLYQKVLNVDRK